MFDEAAVERRLSALEQEVAELRRQVAATQPVENWLDRVSRVVTNKEALMQAAEYGRQIRAADMPDDEPEQP